MKKESGIIAVEENTPDVVVDETNKPAAVFLPQTVEVNNRGTRRRYFRFIQKQLWKELNARWREQGVGN